jgi:phosphate:Na+ symporter
LLTTILGGVGLFLLGMLLMSDGLKAAAGEALRDVLGRFTGGPVQAFLSGAALTALVQSSSATIVTTIGFVSAGLLAFPQAVGVVFGAAVGTTSTGWLVAFLGLRLSISAFGLPLVGVGALLRLLGRGRLVALGAVLAGLGLIFVGIDTLQAGMELLSGRFDLARFDGEGVGARLLLVLVGTVMTVVMQSSSAAVATTLAALAAGTLSLEQAAALVIGQNTGASVPALLASIGAAAPARRTAAAHVVLNTASGVLALLLLPLWLGALRPLAAHLGAPGAIAVFHTGFTLVGVLLLLPVTGRFAAFIARRVPERGPALTRNLDVTAYGVGPVAVEAARRTVRETAATLFDAVAERLAGGRSASAAAHVDQAITAADAALDETRAFLAGVHTSPDAGPSHARHLGVLHAIDHLERLVVAIRREAPLRIAHSDATLELWAEELARALREAEAALCDEAAASPEPALAALSRDLARKRRRHRPSVMESTATGELDPNDALRRLDAMRWLDRLAYHAWRATLHLSRDETDVPDGVGGSAPRAATPVPGV